MDACGRSFKVRAIKKRPQVELDLVSPESARQSRLVVFGGEAAPQSDLFGMEIFPCGCRILPLSFSPSLFHRLAADRRPRRRAILLFVAAYVLFSGRR